LGVKKYCEEELKIRWWTKIKLNYNDIRRLCILYIVYGVWFQKLMISDRTSNVSARKDWFEKL
jgi:hypothetical protein